MTAKTKVSSQGRTVIPAEIRKELGIREGEEVEWTLKGEVIVAKPVREEKTPDEIMEQLRSHLVEVRSAPYKAGSDDMKRRVLNEWARKKLGLMQ